MGNKSCFVNELLLLLFKHLLAFSCVWAYKRTHTRAHQMFSYCRSISLTALILLESHRPKTLVLLSENTSNRNQPSLNQTGRPATVSSQLGNGTLLLSFFNTSAQMSLIFISSNSLLRTKEELVKCYYSKRFI